MMFISFITLFTVVSYFYLNALGGKKKKKKEEDIFTSNEFPVNSGIVPILSKGQKILITYPESIQSVQSHVDSLEMLPY